MHENLKQYTNKYKNRTAFILGSGPSLRNLDPESLKLHIVIAVNAAIMKVPTAQYYFSCDYGMVLWESWQTLKYLKCDLILASNCGFTPFESCINIKVFDGIDKKRIHYIHRKENNMIDKGDRLIKGSSSIHPAVHFVHILGCSPIVLLGCDCKYVNGKKHYYEFPNQPLERLLKPEYNKFRRPLSPSNPGGRTDGELCHHIKIWNELNLNHINIIDASDGALKRFPKMSLKRVLKL